VVFIQILVQALVNRFSAKFYADDMETRDLELVSLPTTVCDYVFVPSKSANDSSCLVYINWLFVSFGKI
jgi:hypothetical protein